MYISCCLLSILLKIDVPSSIEWLIMITALAYVILSIFENIWCWLFGIISTALSIYLCYAGKLFLESGLQIFYVVLGVYGWYQWLHGSAEKKELTIVTASALKIVLLIILGLVIWLPLGWVANHYSTQAMPYLDAFITSFSLVATWMSAKKIIQNWLFWILIDALAVRLYWGRSFYLIGIIYIIYVILAAAGYMKWKKERKKLFA